MSLQSLNDAIAFFNPVRDYRLQEPSGTTAEDFGSAGVDLTHQTGVVAGAEGPGGLLAVDYAGASDQPSSSTTMEAIADDQSFIFILKSASATNPGALEYVLGQLNDADNYVACIFNTTTGTVRLTHSLATNILTWISTADWYDGEWHVIGFSVNHSGATIAGYVDGVAVAGSASAAGLACNANFNLGARYAGGFGFTGKIHRCAVINAALTPQNHTDLYAAFLTANNANNMRNLSVGICLGF